MATSFKPLSEAPALTEHRSWRDREPSDKALRYLYDLIKRHQTDALGPIPTGVTAGQVSDAINWCKRQPMRERTTSERRQEISGGVYTYHTDKVDVMVRVRHSVYRSTRQYAEFWSTKHERWTYTPGLLASIQRNLTGGSGHLKPLTSQEASAFGKLYGRCIRCSRTLTDDNSIMHGYGQTCAEHEGWEW